MGELVDQQLTCGQCGLLLSAWNEHYVDSGYPKYWIAGPTPKDIVTIVFCSPNCSLNWHTARKSNKS